MANTTRLETVGGVSDDRRAGGSVSAAGHQRVVPWTAFFALGVAFFASAWLAGRNFAGIRDAVLPPPKVPVPVEEARGDPGAEAYFSAINAMLAERGGGEWLTPEQVRQRRVQLEQRLERRGPGSDSTVAGAETDTGGE